MISFLVNVTGFVICGIININLKRRTRKGTHMKLYITMVVLVLLDGSEAWTVRKKDI
jgi:hypothetical protein